MTAVKLILASTSPRRKTLLEQIGLNIEIHPSQIEEPAFHSGDPVRYAINLANLKAVEVANRFPGALVIGADTIVIVESQVLGKPEDAEAARKMLSSLSGRTHQVVTAYSLQLKNRDINQNYHVLTQVHFKSLSQAEIDHYIRSRAPFDKAGAYGIQDYSGVFVDRIEGCFYNVVGFPLSDFNSQLKILLSTYNLVLK